MKSLIYSVVTVGMLFTATLWVAAQTGRDRGTNSVHTFGMSGEQTAQIREATQNSNEMTELTDKLALARKEAIEAALGKDATIATVRTKIEAVAKIQTEIAMLRYREGVKVILPSVTDEQKAQMLQVPGIAYNQLFVGNTSGSEFVRGGQFVPNRGGGN